MSRSYKKFPIFRDNLWGKSMKKGKQYNNRKIRRKLKDINIDVGNGRHYKSIGIDSWDLYEYKSLQTKQDAIDQYNKDLIEITNGVAPWKKSYMKNYSLDKAIIDWYLSYKRK